jgi:hypothetical protein
MHHAKVSLSFQCSRVAPNAVAGMFPMGYPYYT